MNSQETKKIITIHQPDFMPWLGLFYKINKSDLFVILDHVQMDVKNSKWLKRVKMFVNNKSEWISIPLLKPKEGHMQAINEILIDVNNKEFKKKKNQIINQYSKHPFFNEVEPLIDVFFDTKVDSVQEKNIQFIKSVLLLLDIKTEIVISSELEIQSSKNQMNIDIIKLLKGDVYMSGMGADGYQIECDFEKENIKLEYSNFNPLNYQYSQKGGNEFVEGLSVLDAICNVGIDKLKEMLNEN